MNIFSHINSFFQKTLFNPNGKDYTEDIWDGEPNGILRVNNAQNKRIISLYDQMRQNFWTPQKVSLTEDKNDFYLMSPHEQKAFRGIVSYLTFLDSIQVNNLVYIKIPIKNSEFNLCLAEQISQEAMHTQSYQYIIDTVVPPELRENTYKYWKDDEILLKRCEYIADFYQAYNDSPSDYSYACMILANYLLEGLYFYNGFTFFYTLANRKLMPAVADIIKLIHRDEITHVYLHQQLLIGLLATDRMPLSQDEIYSLFDIACKKEQEWANSIIGDNILGITSASIENYTKYLTNIRLKAIGIPFLYPNIENPYKHLESFADIDEQALTKSNFFEATVTSYQMASSVKNWDF